MHLIRFVSAVVLLATVHIPQAMAQEEETPSRIEFSSLQGELVAERVAWDLSEPIAIEFLPDGKALVAHRDKGIISKIDFSNGERTDIEGLSDMWIYESAGIHDLELHPEFAKNGWIYVVYSVGEEIHHTIAVDRFQLKDNKASKQERIFLADAYSDEPYHQGGRIVFSEGYLFLAIGDRQRRDKAQDRTNHAGSILRLNDDGSVPKDNPFVDEKPERGDPPRPEIWSYGHRNPMGLYVHPESGEMWSHEHGPRGGDEVNKIVKGGNYGWPTASYGFEYDGGPIYKGITWEEGIEQPVWVYVPSIAPSDLVIYDGAAIPAWKGSFLIGAMGHQHLNRIVFNSDGRVVAEERLFYVQLGRIKSIAVDEAGLIYLGSDSGTIWRVGPR